MQLQKWEPLADNTIWSNTLDTCRKQPQRMVQADPSQASGDHETGSEASEGIGAQLLCACMGLAAHSLRSLGTPQCSGVGYGCRLQAVLAQIPEVSRETLEKTS